jgi:GH43 family beta-xylosidase
MAPQMDTVAYRNPVYYEYFADPFVWKADGEYYAIGTGQHEADGTTRRADQPTVFPLIRSSDLVNWRPAGRALIPPSPDLGTAFWAPEVAFDGTRWFLYYSVGHDDRLHQLRVAISDAPLGPYVDATALTNLDDCSFAIDPHPFRDDDGRWYLFYARDFLTTEDERGTPLRAGTALVVRPMTSMTQLSSDERTVARARCDWQRFAEHRLMYGRHFDWHTLEGPFVVKDRGRYYCFFSGGCWQTDTYGVDYVVADSVLGSYSDEGVERGPRVLKTVPDRVIGPGHCSVVDGPHQTRYLAYHAWDRDRTARRLFIDALSFSADGPHCDGPTWTEQRMPIGSG